MNVFRSLARDLWNVVDLNKKTPEVGGKTLDAVRQQQVPPVLGLSRFRDGFEQFPQGAQGTLRTLQAERAYRPGFKLAALKQDGFDGGSRRSPVDLSGGVKAKYSAREESAPAHNDFSASIDDLAALL